MRLILIILLLPILTIGCNKAYFQPPEAAYYYYQKPGATKLDVKKAMLDCGTEPIYGYSSNTDKHDVNTPLLAAACMERLGFRDIEGWSFEKLCNLEHNKQYPACQPDAVIPKPSVERRLNSEYCQSMRKYYPEGLKRCIENKEYSESMCRKAYYKRMECYP